MAIHRIGTPGTVLTDAPQGQRQAATVAELNERAREVLRHVVESYVETGEPVGSRALTRKLTEALSPATIRNIMADLQDLGLLYAPHTSAGRLPTDAGLKLFVNGLLEVGNLSEEERESIEVRCAAAGRGVNEALEQATTLLSGLSRCASLVMAPKTAAAEAHRVRQSRARPGAGRDRDAVGSRREPPDRGAARPAGLGARGGNQLPQCAPGRPHHRGGAPAHP
jgi:heat-inducible transcriptional repressor